MSHAATQNVIVTRGTLADIPPPPSLFGLLDSFREALTRRITAEAQAKAQAYDRAQRAADWAFKQASDHSPEMLEFIRRRKGEWVRTIEIQAEIVRLGGPKIDFGNIAKVLRANRVQEIQRNARCMWRVK